MGLGSVRCLVRCEADAYRQFTVRAGFGQGEGGILEFRRFPADGCGCGVAFIGCGRYRAGLFGVFHRERIGSISIGFGCRFLAFVHWGCCFRLRFQVLHRHRTVLAHGQGHFRHRLLFRRFRRICHRPDTALHQVEQQSAPAAAGRGRRYAPDLDRLGIGLGGVGVFPEPDLIHIVLGQAMDHRQARRVERDGPVAVQPARGLKFR